MMKSSTSRRAIYIANAFNLLVSIYLVTISIVSLVRLRWYHQLTVLTKWHHFISAPSSYIAFIILLAVALLLAFIFFLNSLHRFPKIYINLKQDQSNNTNTVDSDTLEASKRRQLGTSIRRTLETDEAIDEDPNSNAIGTLDSRDLKRKSAFFWSICVHLLASVGLVVTIIIWLLNAGELIRDAIAGELEFALSRYQYFSGRQNFLALALDGIQASNGCCGALDYTLFPRFRMSGLVSGSYPGSCCGKGQIVRYTCSPEEVIRARQTVSFFWILEE